MANRLLVRDGNKNVWGKISVRVFWEGGGQDGVWIDESGTGEFNGVGVVDYVMAPGEKIEVSRRVDGNTSLVLISKDSH